MTPEQEAQFVKRGMEVYRKVIADQAEYRRVMGIPISTLMFSEREMTLLMSATAGAAWAAETSGVHEQVIAYNLLNKKICESLDALVLS